jgi:hypothetical protein
LLAICNSVDVVVASVSPRKVSSIRARIARIRAKPRSVWPACGRRSLIS